MKGCGSEKNGLKPYPNLFILFITPPKKSLDVLDIYVIFRFGKCIKFENLNLSLPVVISGYNLTQDTHVFLADSSLMTHYSIDLTAQHGEKITFKSNFDYSYKVGGNNICVKNVS